MVNTECGIYCIVSKLPITSHRIISGLESLQHRGRDSFGVSYLNHNHLKVEKHQGLVRNLDLHVVSPVWLGHVRYSTSTKSMKYCQPILSDSFSIVHNGNIKSNIWDKILSEEKIYHNPEDSDTYKLKVLLEHYLQNNQYTMEQSLVKLLNIIEGSFCVLIQTKENIYIVRDRYGFKPLSYLREGNRIDITSESENPLARPFGKGSLFKLNVQTLDLTKLYQFPETKSKKCIFEYIYFMRESTYFDDRSVKEWRQETGKKLFLQSQDKFSHLDKSNTLVCGVPSSGIVYGESFSHYSGFEYCQFLKKKKDYPHRTFILPDNTKRMDACRRKYFVDTNIKNKNIIILDDSVVRGNTMKFLVDYLRDFQPKEIHLLVGCPEIVQPCFYGVDFPDIEELVANKMSSSEMKDYFNLDSITFLNLSSLKDSDSYCSACFDGNHPF